MSDALTHSPAAIVQQLFVDLSLGTDPDVSGSWPVYAYREPDTPDSVIGVHDTVGETDGRLMPTGEAQSHYGIMVRVRDANPVDGWTKVKAIRTSMSETVLDNTVTVSSTNYHVQCFSNISQITHIGKNPAISDRDWFTVNSLVTLNQL